MVPVEVDLVAVGVEHLRDEQPQFAVAEDRNRLVRRNLHLVEDFTGGGEGLGEDGAVCRNGLGDDVQVALGKREEFLESAGVVHDSEDGAVRAMAEQALVAPFAARAGQVDLAGHALTDERGCIGFGHFGDEFVARRSGEAVIAALQLEIGIADSGAEEAQQRKAVGTLGTVDFAHRDGSVFEVDRKHAPIIEASMTAELACFDSHCRARYGIDEVIYNCPKCGGLLEAVYDAPARPAADFQKLWRERRLSNDPLDQSGVWRYREFLPFLDDYSRVVTLREGDTPLLAGKFAAEYGGLDALVFKHQGFNPTGSFKDNGMTCGVAQALRLGMERVACVSTGNTSASMAAYASAAGLQPIIFIPHGNIAYGKLAQALEYGARTLQVEANFDQILAMVREVAEKLGIYLLNSINPFRIEGQKTIMTELLDQRDWRVPDWIVLPGGNLGNTSAFGKALREMKEWGLIERLPRLAVVQAEGASPFYELYRGGAGAKYEPVAHPQTLATAIKIGDPVSWPKALREVCISGGVVERVTEQEIADAKAVIGRCGIGCEPASAATLAGIRKLTYAGTIRGDADVVAILTGNVLKDPDYIHQYHTNELTGPDGAIVQANFGNSPEVVGYDISDIQRKLSR